MKNPKTCKHLNYTTELTEFFCDDDGSGVDIHCNDCGKDWTT